MNRDLICCARLCLDSLPSVIRNSRFLFEIVSFFFRLPNSLYEFRSIYKSRQIVDLSIFYDPRNSFSLPRVSSLTDINSRHLSLIYREYKRNDFNSVLDVGCGTGFLLNALSNIKYSNKDVRYCGIDYVLDSFQKFHSDIHYIEGDLLSVLRDMPDSCFQLVTCCHVLEHLISPHETLVELRRVCSGSLIIVCPLEKEFCWGLNYHVNFFPKLDDFVNFIDSINSKRSFSFEYHHSLGDIMYVQHFL